MVTAMTGEGVNVAHSIKRSDIGNVGTSNAHTDTNISALNGRRIVNAVTRHSCDHALLAPGINNANLVLRLNACINANCLNALLKLFIRDLIKLCTGKGSSQS